MAQIVATARARRIAMIPAFAMGLSALPATAQERTTGFNLYGVPGIVDMPNANMAPDATLSTTFSGFGDNIRTTLAFQLTPRLQAAFRYSGVRNLPITGAVDGTYYDRSFDLRYRLLKEGRLWPSVVVGLQDLVGTGLYSGEYIVATKEAVPGLQLTGGVGWGRLGSDNAFATTGTRPTGGDPQGGTLTPDRWFKGDVAGFGGISYSPDERLTFKAEYSSDRYDFETRKGEFNGSSNWNYGIDYRSGRGHQISLYYAYGAKIGAQFTIHTNPKAATVPGGAETAPVAGSRRPDHKPASKRP